MKNQGLFIEIGDAYLQLVHLDAGIDEAVARIQRAAESLTTESISELLRDGDSWRERMVGLVLASHNGIQKHSQDLIAALQNTGGISIVPIYAATSIAVRDFACPYDRKISDSLDRDAWDGEIGFAIDWLHYTIGIGDTPGKAMGPNYGQDFAKHRSFYAKLSMAGQT
ncbi:hypothetical protein [Rhodopirellula europaea]|uniref:Uncharacterized protein n=1 Tax=Rhodopirellula europaea 6C TaxID=1263867 RepID=M2ATY7_9BACT|nr:hypothetical protein [Rhodopirellula europaea]EMB13464.1 hypothetical protein RE6C_05822 [Rhodopirellula europaea 6C]